MIPEINRTCLGAVAAISAFPSANQVYRNTQLLVENLSTIDKLSDAYEAAQKAFFCDSEQVATSLENLASTLDTSLFAMFPYKKKTLLFGDIPRQKIILLLHLATNARELTISAICKHCLQPANEKNLDATIQQKALGCLNSIRHEIPFNRKIHRAIQQLNSQDTSSNICFPELDRMIEAFYRIEDSTSEFLYLESKKDR